MKNLIILPLIAFFCACNRDPGPEEEAEATPQALVKEKSYSSAYNYSDDRGINIVDALYQEAIGKNSALKALDERIRLLNEATQDTLKVNQEYNLTSNDYFQAAQNYTLQLSDTVLKNTLQAYLSEYSEAQAERTRSLDQLLLRVQANQVSLQDQEIVLKLTTTIPMLVNYQKNELPSKKALLLIKKDQDSLSAALEKHINLK